MTPDLLDSWTLKFLRDHRAILAPGSLLRYRRSLLREARGLPHPAEVMTLHLRPPMGGPIQLRSKGADPYTFREVFVKRVYEPIAARVPDAATVIDLGANIGLATRYLAGRYPGCRVLAVEPDPANCELLAGNVEGLIAEGRCRTLRAAAWHRRAGLVVRAPEGTEGHHNALSVREAEAGESAEVEALTMADLIDRSGFERVDVLKVDVEGAEAALFRGDLAWLDRVGAIAIEFHGEARREGGFDRAMADAGLLVDDSHPHTTIAHRARWAH